MGAKWACGRLGIASFLVSTVAAQQLPRVELGALTPPAGTRIENLQQLGGATAPDLDGDGLTDFVLAAPSTHYFASYAGSVYVLFGPMPVNYSFDPELDYPTRGLRIDGLESIDGLGRSLGRAGDLNADGIDDVAFNTDDRSFVIFGGPHLRSLTSIDLATLDGTLGFQFSTHLSGDNAQLYAPIGDVNADGDDDLFIGFPRKDDPWTNISLRNDVRSAIIGDIDGDGDQDIVASEGNYDTLVLLFNAGDGTFPTRSTLNMLDSADLYLVDLDDDDDLDLIGEWEKFVTGTQTEGWFSVFLNQGAGTFGGRVDYKVGAISRGVQLAFDDLDGDGDTDVAGINFLFGTSTPTNPFTELHSFSNDGTGHFTTRQDQIFAYHSNDLELLDADGDLDLDILVSNEHIVSPTVPVVRIYANNGAGLFVPDGGLLLDGFALSMATGDLDGDGRDDLFTGYRLFPNSATGLQAGIPLAYPDPFTTPFSLADLDGNGTLDMLVGDDSDGVQLHFNPGDGIFDRHRRCRYNALRGRPSAGDLDGDGDLDLVVQQRAQLSLAFNRGHGAFGGGSSGAAYVVFGRAGLGAGGLLDLDALGGDGFAIPGAESFANVGLSASAAGDMNGDLVDDFVFTAPFTDGDFGDLYVVYGAPGLGAGGRLDPQDLTPATGIHIHGVDASGFCRTVLGDLDTNGDGRPDLVAGGPNADVNGMNEAGRVSVIFNKPTLLAAGTFDLNQLDGPRGYALTGITGTFLGVSLVALGDFDGDGKDDFAAGASGDDTAGPDRGAVYLMFGDPRPAGGSLTVRGLHGRYGTALYPALDRGFVGNNLAAGDWNADGRVDLYIPSPAYSPGAPNPGSVHLLWDLETMRARWNKL